MSQENVEIVRRVGEAFRRGEWEQAAQLLDADVELHGTVGGLSEGSVVRGLQQIRQEFQQEDPEAWDERRLEPERFIDGGNRVVVLRAGGAAESSSRPKQQSSVRCATDA